MDFLGLDVGTTGCKAVVFGEDGRARGSSYAEYGMVCDEPSQAEQDAEAVWAAALDVLERSLAQAGTRELSALSVSVQGDAIIPVDDRWRPIGPAILGMDYRSQPDAERCADLFGDFALFQRTGMRPLPVNSLCKIAWLKRTRPAVFDGAWKIVTYADYILGRLGSPPVIDWTMASRTMAFDLDRHIWVDDILDRLQIDVGMLSEPVPSGSEVGALRPELSRRFGIAGRTRLIAGGHDQACAALGSGVLGAGLAVISTGTAEVLSTVLDRPERSRKLFEGYYPCYCFVVPDRYMTFSLNHVGGLLLRWFRDNFSSAEVTRAAEQGTDVYELMLSGIPASPTSVMVLPHLAGSGNPWFDAASKGAFVGLTTATTRQDIMRALLEAQCFELAVNLDSLGVAGIDIGELRATGGGARSTVWLQMKADVLGRPISALESQECACLGAGILAGCAAGVFDSPAQGVECCVRTSATYLPSVERGARYAERLGMYRELYSALKNLHHRL